MLRRTRGDVETILGSYAPDAVVLPPNSPAVQGLVAIRQFWEALLAAGYRNAGFELDEIDPRGRSRQVRGSLAPESSVARWKASRGLYLDPSWTQFAYRRSSITDSALKTQE
jgi:hypothetical protein